MSTNRKVLVSQILCLPFVGLPSLIGGLFLGSLVCNRLQIETGIVSSGLIFVCMIGLAWLTARITGSMLCRIGLLPHGSQRIYPRATSRDDYQTESEAWALRRSRHGWGPVEEVDAEQSASKRK